MRHGDRERQRLVRTPPSRPRKPRAGAPPEGSSSIEEPARNARRPSSHRKMKEHRGRTNRSSGRIVKCGFTRVARWGFGSIARGPAAQAEGSPRELNDPLVLVIRGSIAEVGSDASPSS